MSKKKESKTNAMRILDAAHVDHVIHSVDATGEDTGVDIAHRAGEDPDHVFKTLVTQGKSGEHFVFMIPVACELDLRKAARAAGEKSVAMVRSRELFELTGYVHGGCSPLGMKKPFRTFIDETCILFDEIAVSAGARGKQIILAPHDLIAYTSAEVF